MSSKIILVGDELLDNSVLSTITHGLYEIIPVPANFPPNCLAYLGEVLLIVINLPSKDCSLIQQWHRQVDLPIIALMKEIKITFLQKAYRSGAADVILVPIDEEELFNSLQRLTQLKYRSQENISNNKPPESSPYIIGILPTLFQKLIPEKPQAPITEVDISIKFFGTFSVYIKGKYVLKNLSKQRQSLLAYLLFHARKRIPKDRLITLFWEDSMDDSARNSLNVALHGIRKIIAKAMPEEEFLQYEQGCYFINPMLRIETDITQLNTFYEKGRTLDRKGDAEAAATSFYAAYAYYRGVFLENLYDAPWTEGERAHLAERYMNILNKLSQYFLRQKDWEAAEQFARQMLKQDNCLEEAHRIIMQCAYFQGAKDRAIRQYQECKNHLESRLTITPSVLTENLLRAISSGKMPNSNA